jgi:hypothetical protein
MAFVIKDRVKETTTTTGTGAVSLGGASSNFVTFSSVLSDGDTTYYAIVDSGNTAFEVGLGTYASSGNTIARTTILSSSNSDAIVDLQSGTKFVFCAFPADKAVVEDATGKVTIDSNVGIESGLIDLKNDGTASRIKFYCESNNAHAQTVQSAPHSAAASNTLVLPATGSNLVSDTATQTLTNKTLTSPKINEDVAVTSTATEINLLDGVTATTAELNYLDITTLGTTEASKAVTADANGVVTFDNGISEEYIAVTSSSNATTVNLRDGTNFSHTLTENTTFTYSNSAASGKVSAFTLKIVQDASASGYTVTWPGSVDWPGGTAPTLTATASAVDVFVFYTHDGGTTYYGFTAGQALA